MSSTCIMFAEAMSGFVARGESTFVIGRAAGQSAGTRLTLQVKVSIEDLEAFLQDPQRLGRLEGQVLCDLWPEPGLILQGQFRLLPHTADHDRRIMNYRTVCQVGGQKFTLIGEKEVQSELAGLDLWHDTTTLFTNLYEGEVELEDACHHTVWASGIIGLGFFDFIKVLSSLRAETDGHSSPLALLQFGRYFAGQLWQVYGPHRALPVAEEQHPYPRFSNQGVKNARVEIHPFSTDDGLTLSWTRFQRAPCQDVVVLIHGLTTSSDMFIMPEHQNLVNELLDQGFGEVWCLDYRGSQRFPYNLYKTDNTLDDIALFDHPAAFRYLQQQLGPEARIHVIAHCVGSLTFSMSLAAGLLPPIQSAVLNSVSFTPNVPAWSKVKLALGPTAADCLGMTYFNPGWRREPGGSVGKLLAWGLDQVHQECDSPECHTLSFMWGAGRPALFLHQNMHPVTHARLGDLFGGVSVNYYRHVRQMVSAGHTAVRYQPTPERHQSLPPDYFVCAPRISTPLLFIQGQQNRVFADSNILSFQRLDALVPGRHQLHVFPDYGHQDIFMGQHVARDIFPRLITFLRAHSLPESA